MSQEQTRPDLSSLRIHRDEVPASSHSNPRRGRGWVWTTGGALVVLAIALYLIFGRGGSVEVRTATVTRLAPASAQSLLTATGYIVAQRAAAVASKGTGRLEVLNVQEGDSVHAGDIIARLEAADVSASLTAARATLKESEARLEFAKAQGREAELRFNRTQELKTRNLASEAEYDQARASHETAVANIAAAEAALKASQANVSWSEVQVENTIIRAPFDGTVLTKEADVGEVVAPFASSASSRGAVVTIADLSSLEAEADVSEANIQQILVDQPCLITLDAFPAEPYRGRVMKIVPTADRSKATVMVKVAFDQLDRRVLPEMSAKINFLPNETGAEAISTETVLTVPSDAVVQRNGNSQVFVVRQGKATAHNVTVGRSYGGAIEIISGAAEGDVVVVAPPAKLSDGDAVELIE